MKNKIQKNNKKNTDQSSRSRSIKSRWAVRLLVLLVMLTTILASFVVPASAADPFTGGGKIEIETFDFYFNGYGDQFYFPLTLGRIDYITSQDNLNFYIESGVSNGVFSFTPQAATSNYIAFKTGYTVRDVPFISCDKNLNFNSFDTAFDVPAGYNIIEYLTENNPDALDYPLQRINFASYTQTYKFVLKSDSYSVVFQGGIKSVFDLIGSWLSNTFNTLGGVFYDNGSLTVLGGLAIGSLGVSVILLLIKVISNFIRFRG